MFDRVPVYAYLLGALISLVIGLGLLYAGIARVGPVFLFGFVLLTILAAIRFTTPPIARTIAAAPDAAESPVPARESLPERLESHRDAPDSSREPYESLSAEARATHDHRRDDT